jgi:2,3-bisphosphoglycerate-independent phosphoglycerate mutase
MILNFANCDMVGHTGVYEAAKKAVETVDNCVRKVAEQILLMGGTLFVTADHGNAEKMLEKGQPFTAHTTNPVPFIMVSQNAADYTLADGGALSDIAPTMLDSMGIDIPTQMTGRSLLVK